MEQAYVWVVIGGTGEYSDHREWIVYAFESEEHAKAIVEKLSSLGRVAMQSAMAEFNSYWKWKETEAGKALLLEDEEARIDYTGINYTASKVVLVKDLK